MSTWLQDVRYAFRQLRKSPGFTIVAMLTLAMAIAANAVVFSVLNGLVLRPLNVPQAESLYLLERVIDNDTTLSYPDYVDFRERNHSFEGLTASAFSQVSLNSGEGPSLIWGIEASTNYFDVLRLHPYLGRFFHDSDDHGPNRAPYIVLSYAYWHTHFHDDRGVLGRVVQLNQHPFTIIGVASPAFRGTVVFISPEFFVPLENAEQVDGPNYLKDRTNRFTFMTISHLKPVVSWAAATADLNSIAVFAKNVSERGKTGRIYVGASESFGRSVCPRRKGIHCGIDAACWIDSAGCMRQPRQLVCRTRC